MVLTISSSVAPTLLAMRAGGLSPESIPNCGALVV